MNLADQNYYQQEIATLRARLDTVEEENRQLKMKRISNHPIVRVILEGIHLSQNAENIIYCLAQEEFVTYDTLWQFLYGHRPLDEHPDREIVKIYLTKIRKKLTPLGVEIKTVRGRGLSMNEAGRAIIKANSERYDGGLS